MRLVWQPAPQRWRRVFSVKKSPYRPQRTCWCNTCCTATVRDPPSRVTPAQNSPQIASPMPHPRPTNTFYTSIFRPPYTRCQLPRQPASTASSHRFTSYRTHFHRPISHSSPSSLPPTRIGPVLHPLKSASSTLPLFSPNLRFLISLR